MVENLKSGGFQKNSWELLGNFGKIVGNPGGDAECVGNLKNGMKCSVILEKLWGIVGKKENFG